MQVSGVEDQMPSWVTYHCLAGMNFLSNVLCIKSIVNCVNEYWQHYVDFIWYVHEASITPPIHIMETTKQDTTMVCHGFFLLIQHDDNNNQGLVSSFVIVMMLMLLQGFIGAYMGGTCQEVEENSQRRTLSFSILRE